MTRTNKSLAYVLKACLGFGLAFMLGLGMTLEQTNAAPPLAKVAETRGTYSLSLPLVTQGTAQVSSLASDWLIYLNYYRSLAGLPGVAESQEWNLGGHYHARYTVKNDILVHGENVNNEWFTPEGSAAAESGNLMASSDPQSSDTYAIDAWMQAPFHALGILDPALLLVGFGSYREPDGGFQMGATLDVLRGLGEITEGVVFPVIWPADGTVVPIGKFWGETPDPLTSCAGYSAPTGLPLILQVGAGEQEPVVNAHSIMQGSTLLEHCMFTENTYMNPDSAAQDKGRAILDMRDAIILIPRDPLTPGGRYTVSIEVDGSTYVWTFEVGGPQAQAVQSLNNVEIR